MYPRVRHPSSGSTSSRLLDRTVGNGACAPRHQTWLSCTPCTPMRPRRAPILRRFGVFQDVGDLRMTKTEARKKRPRGSKDGLRLRVALEGWVQRRKYEHHLKTNLHDRNPWLHPQYYSHQKVAPLSSPSFSKPTGRPGHPSRTRSGQMSNRMSSDRLGGGMRSRRSRVGSPASATGAGASADAGGGTAVHS